MGLNFGMHSVTLIQVPDEPDGFLRADQLNWSIAATSLGAVLGGLLSAPMIVTPTRRALFTTLLNFMVYLGQVLALAVAPLLHWQVLFIVVGVVPATLCLFGLLFLPNSAKWLLSRGHSEEEAVRSIQFFRGVQEDVASEIRSIHDSLQHAHVDGTTMPMWTLLRQPGTWRPLLLASVQMVLTVWCGGPTLLLITAFVLAPVRLPLSEYQRATLPAALAALVCVPGGITIERYGRLPVLRLGGALSAIGCATIAAYFFLAAESQERLAWIVPVGAVLTQVAFVGMVGNVAFNYATELLPNNTRTWGANIVLTTVQVKGRTYSITRLGFGLDVAPLIMKTVVQAVLRENEAISRGVLAYVDALLVGEDVVSADKNKGAGEMLIRHRIGLMRQLVDEFQLSVTVQLVQS
ncbi:sugar transporter ERD6-like 16 [Pollicipes pollicipes]|uniref:sugar transporter ERD6-like 16 n=1 Tax=Pollicipes pollicipes TaxID=41117 RepID=UPI00188512C6|nr:sugar transporter ERD6-like 16 [Pollicipes pollicipes]